MNWKRFVAELLLIGLAAISSLYFLVPNFSRHVVMPSNTRDVGSWGPAFNRATNKPLLTPEERDAAVKQCAASLWVTVESNDKAREQAVKDVLDFLKSVQ